MTMDLSEIQYFITTRLRNYIVEHMNVLKADYPEKHYVPGIISIIDRAYPNSKLILGFYEPGQIAKSNIQRLDGIDIFIDIVSSLAVEQHHILLDRIESEIVMKRLE